MAEAGNKVRSGGCLCGAVRFTAAPANREVGACHCSMCRRWSAGPFLVRDCGTTLKIADPSSLGVYRSSEWAERAFCKTDTHWSGAGIAIAAARIAERVKALPWYEPVPKQRFTAEERKAEIEGDLRRMLGDAGGAPETLALRFVEGPDGRWYRIVPKPAKAGQSRRELTCPPKTTSN